MNSNIDTAPQDHPLHVLRDRLDELLASLRSLDASPVPLRDMMTLVGSSLQQVYIALASAGDHDAFSSAMVVASLELERAVELVETSSAGGDSLSRALREAERLTRAAHPDVRLPGAGIGPVFASSDEAPRLLARPTDAVMPVLPLRRGSALHRFEPLLAPDPDPVASLEELDLLLDSAEALGTAGVRDRGAPALAGPDVGVSPTARDVLAEIAVINLEELGAFGRMRAPGDGQTWTGKRRLERRLLARVDAIVACGIEALQSIVHRLEACPLPDPALSWGAIFLFGSLSGDDMVDEAVRLARASGLEDDEIRDAVVDAFALMPNRAVELRLRRWLESDRAHERSVAVAALGRRGGLSADELARAAGDESTLVVREAAGAVRSTLAVRPEVLDRLFHHSDLVVEQRALFGGMVHCESGAVRRARSLVTEHRGAHAGAALVYALTGGRSALEPLLEDAAVSGSPLALRALGWFGHTSAIPYLIGRLDGDERTVRDAAAALARLAGGNAPNEEGAWSASPVLPRSAPVSDPDRWRAWWRAVKRVDQPLRVRFGAPWRSVTNSMELEAPASTLGVRELSSLELVARMGVASGFDPRAFVAEQGAQLELLRHEIDGLAQGTGAWPTRFHL